MLIEFSVENFRSIKEKQIFNLVAEESRAKENNVSIQTLAGKNSLRLLKTAMVYGANASGKSNLLQALAELKKMTIHRAEPQTAIPAYSPFKFDPSCKSAPTTFSLKFIGPKDYDYHYHIKFERNTILEESLNYFEGEKEKNLFKRGQSPTPEAPYDLALLSDDISLPNFKVFKNHTVLSYFGETQIEDWLTKINFYFRDLEIYGSEPSHADALFNSVRDKITTSDVLKTRLSKLISFADTKIESIALNEGKLTIKSKIQDLETESRLFGVHKVYKDSELVGTDTLPFSEESKGTNALFALGGKLLEVLERGGIIFIDEMDTSLHPKLVLVLVLMFQSEVCNPRNAQLVFTTHDTTLMNERIFRRDQIWFTERDEFGATDLYSLQDFDDVTEETPFESWYLVGKFGAIPNIRMLERIFLTDPVEEKE